MQNGISSKVVKLCPDHVQEPPKATFVEDIPEHPKDIIDGATYILRWFKKPNTVIKKAKQLLDPQTKL